MLVHLYNQTRAICGATVPRRIIVVYHYCDAPKNSLRRQRNTSVIAELARKRRAEANFSGLPFLLFLHR